MRRLPSGRSLLHSLALPPCCPPKICMRERVRFDAWGCAVCWARLPSPAALASSATLAANRSIHGRVDLHAHLQTWTGRQAVKKCDAGGCPQMVGAVAEGPQHSSVVRSASHPASQPAMPGMASGAAILTVEDSSRWGQEHKLAVPSARPSLSTTAAICTSARVGPALAAAAMAP